RRRRHVALRKPHRASEFPRGDVEQHQVHRPFAKPVLPRRVLPTRQRLLVASNIAHPRPLAFHLTGMKGDLAPRTPPPIATAPFAARVRGPQASAASLSIISPSAAIPAARQKRSKLAETSSKALPTGPRTGSKTAEGKAVAVVIFVFMALLSFRGISTPSLPA